MTAIKLCRLRHWQRTVGVLAVSVVALVATAPASADPDCSGPNRWPASMALATLKNAGLITNKTVDFSRTTSLMIASQKIGADLYRQVFKITFRLKAGGSVTTIVVSDASEGECSISQPTVYRVLADGPR